MITPCWVGGIEVAKDKDRIIACLPGGFMYEVVNGFQIFRWRAVDVQDVDAGA